MASVILSPESRGSRARRISCLSTVGPANSVTWRAGQAETQERHSMQSRSGLIASISSRAGSPASGAGQIRAIFAMTGLISTARSFTTGRSSGSTVIPSRASSMQARPGVPSTRTAQLPHCPDPQQ